MVRPPRRRPSKHTIKALRIKFNLLQSLPSASRATRVIRILDIFSIKIGHNLLAQDNRPMHGSITPVGQRLFVHSPSTVTRGRVVAGICAHHAEAVLEAGAEVEPVYAACETAVAVAPSARILQRDKANNYSPDCQIALIPLHRHAKAESKARCRRASDVDDNSTEGW